MFRPRRPSGSAAVLATALILLSGVLSAAVAEPSAARQNEIIYRLRQDCGSCHGLTLKGGLGPALLPETLAGKHDDALVDIILYGVPTTPMPPWGFEISPVEARWLVHQLKRGITDAR
jgi:cytochrome c55X